MLKATNLIILICFLSSGYSARLKPNNDNSTKSTTTVAPSHDDSVKTSVTAGSDTDQDDMKADDTTKTEEVDAMPDVMAIMNECNETFRIEMSYLGSLNSSGSFPDETDKTPKCFIRCVLENTGIATMEGQYDPELTAMIFAGERGGKPVDDLQDIAVGCAVDRKESCKCERAYTFLKCIMEMEITKYI